MAGEIILAVFACVCFGLAGLLLVYAVFCVVGLVLVSILEYINKEE